MSPSQLRISAGKMLVAKFRTYGIRGKVLQWIEAFLSHLRQSSTTERIIQWEMVKSGVPQYSILGPLLFLFYVNDMSSLIQNTAKMFADDTKLYAKIESRDDCHGLQRDLNQLTAWSRDWFLGFNETKHEN